jgi:hypothetical protein
MAEEDFNVVDASMWEGEEYDEGEQEEEQPQPRFFPSVCHAPPARRAQARRRPGRWQPDL